MSISDLKSELGEYAKDIKLNLGSVMTPEGAPGLSQEQILGISLSCAYTTKNTKLIDAILETAKQDLDDAQINASKIASTLMAMNNVYYRSLHLMENKELSSLPAKLRMNSIGKPGIDRKDFELFCLAVSAINGCGMCLDSHAKVLSNQGVSQEGIQSALRIASVIQATSQALSID